MKAFLFTLLFIHSNSTYSQSELEWKHGIYNYIGKIDTSKANEEELNNVLYLLWQTPDLSKSFLWNSPGDSLIMKITAIEKENESYVQELKNARLPRGSYWETVRQLRIDELEFQCELRVKTLQAYTRPTVLWTINLPCDCDSIISALIGTDKDLMNYWQKQHSLQLIGNHNQYMLEQEFQRLWSSPDRLLWARIEIMKYGWWNCISPCQTSKISEALLEQNFKKLFAEVIRIQ